MKKKYTWKELTVEGRLIDPVSTGPYYDTFALGGNTNEFDTRGDAEVEFVNYHQKYKRHYEVSDNTEYVLLTIYQEEAE